MHNFTIKMNDFLKLNKEFLIKSYYWFSGILTTGFLLYLCFFYNEVTLYWIVIILILTIIILPIFVLSVWTYDWNRKRKYINRIVKQNPYSELEKIGFNKKTIIKNHNSLRDYVPFGEVNGIQIILNVDIRKPNVVEFTTYCNTLNLTSNHFFQKVSELKAKNIELGSHTFTKRIDTKKEKISIQNLEIMLSELTHIVKINKFEPIIITEWKNA